MTAASTSSGPTSDQERVVFWDVLRGFAVLGVLLANIPWMTLARHIATQGEGDEPTARDRFAKAVVFFVADLKFITTFSILFGAGLMWMSLRAEQRGRPFVSIYTRRLCALLGFGVIHGTCIWFGDILSTYAITGFLAMPFHRRRVRTMLIWAGALFVLALASWSIGPLFADHDSESVEAAGKIALKTAEYREVFASGDFLRMLRARSEIFFGWIPMMIGFIMPRTLALFLLGMALVKSGFFTRPAEHRRFYRLACQLGIPIGVLLHVVVFVCSDRDDSAALKIITTAAFFVGSLVQAFGYIGAMQWWTESNAFAALRDRLAAVGRMAFTNYLMHSIITGIVFSYCGLFDRIDRLEGLGVVAAIYGLQLWYSKPWLERFRMGPFEWVWRSLTYGERPAFVRVSAPPEAPPPPTLESPPPG